jgi:hypothetical protein
MSASFRVLALAADAFASLVPLGDDELRSRGMRRVVADADLGFPCRVSLVDAKTGERVLLLPFVHHDVDSPYRASGPIYVREDAVTARPAVGEIPEMLRRRTLSIRAYDAQAMLVAAEVAGGAALDERFPALFADPRVAYLHLHNVAPGCFNCRVERA